MGQAPEGGAEPVGEARDGLRPGPRVSFKPGKGGVYAGKDADGTEVLLDFNDTANVLSCTEIESDLGPDEE